MSIIYSYPTIQPTVDDLLIGTDTSDDNATKSFTVQSLVSLINAAAGSGTVTSVQIATDAFLSASGGPIIDAGTITMGLAATGTPDATTFLRGDNQWVVPTISAGISVLNGGTSLTSDVQSFNFTGDGITASTIGNNVTIAVNAQQQAVTGLAAGAGIALSSTSGNVTISNSGVRQIVGSSGITVSPVSGTGIVTLDVQNQTSGTVTSVTPGPGLALLSGTSTENPNIGINYTGNQNYIIEGDDVAVAASADKVMFNQTSSNNVKTSTLATIPMTAVDAVKTYVDAEDAKAVQNNTDTYSSVAKAQKIITLTDAEYTALATKDGNTLYITTATAATQYTKTLSVVNNITGFANGSLTGDQTGATLTGAAGSNWSFTTDVSADTGYSYTGNAPVTISGTFDSTATVTSTLTGSITQDSAQNCTSTLTGVTLGGNLGSINSSYYTATSSGATSTAACSSTLNSGNVASIFPVTYTLTSAGTAAGYSITTPITVSYSGANGTYSNSASITATVSGAVTQTLYDFAVNIDLTGVTTDSGVTYTAITSGASGTSNTATPGQVTTFTTSNFGIPGATWNEQSNVSSTNGDTSGLNFTTQTTSGTMTGDGTSGSPTTTHTYTGNIASTIGETALTPVTNIIDAPASSYGISYTLNGSSYTVPQPSQGPIGNTADFDFTINVANGFTNVDAGGTFTPSGGLTTFGNPINQVSLALSGRIIKTRVTSSYNSTSHVSSTEACQETSTSDALYLEKGSGSSSYVQTGDTCYTTATGTGVVAAGYYKAFVSGGAGWMRITGSAGVVQSVGNC